MGYEKLIETLRQEGAEKAAAIRKEAEAEGEVSKRKTAEKTATLREEFARRQEEECAAIRREILAEAVREGRQQRLAAEHELAVRLLDLARQALPVLRDERSEGLFASLAGELPQTGWERVRVNPADLEAARPLFPDAEIEPDETVAGGVEVASAGGKLRVVNTLRKRLERAWPELLSRLMADIRRETAP